MRIDVRGEAQALPCGCDAHWHGRVLNGAGVELTQVLHILEVDTERGVLVTRSCDEDDEGFCRFRLDAAGQPLELVTRGRFSLTCENHPSLRW